MSKLIAQIPLSLLLIMLFGSCGGEEKDFIERMADEHQGDTPVKNASADLKQSADVSGQEVTYATIDGEEITGYMAKPEEAADGAPGIIVIHEWWGLNTNIRTMTDKLAGEGYTALAVDLYKGKVAESSNSAGNLAGSVDDSEARDNLSQAYAFLAKEQQAANIGVIGWCFGGGWSLQTALNHPDEIDAAAIYYGRLVTDAEELKKLEMPILGIFGADDESIPPEQAKEFEAALNEAGVSNSIHIYEDAGHAFANPSGDRYVEEAAEDAWQKTTAFFEEHLK